MWFKKCLVLVFVAFVGACADTPANQPATQLFGRKLITEHFIITIVDEREEGVVEGDGITYIGVSKRTGKSIRLDGSTLNSHDPDGAPGQFLGYQFKSGNMTYLVYEDGRLIIERGSHTLIEEEGTWDDEDRPATQP